MKLPLATPLARCKAALKYLQTGRSIHSAKRPYSQLLPQGGQHSPAKVFLANPSEIPHHDQTDRRPTYPSMWLTFFDGNLWLIALHPGQLCHKFWYDVVAANSGLQQASSIGTHTRDS